MLRFSAPEIKQQILIQTIKNHVHCKLWAYLLFSWFEKYTRNKSKSTDYHYLIFNQSAFPINLTFTVIVVFPTI